MRNTRTFLAAGAAVLGLLVASLACSGGATTDPSLADTECALPPDANECETCLNAACGQVCRDCVNDTQCYDCTKTEEPSADCFANDQVGELVACVLGNCQEECAKAPSRKPRQRVGKGKGRKGGGGGGGGGGGSTDGGGGEGKTGKGKGGKSKRGD